MPQRTWRFSALNLFLLFLLIVGVIYVPRLLSPFNPLVLLVIAILIYGVTALIRARNVTTPPRLPLTRTEPKDLGLPDFEDATFPSRDGVQLSGWYIPSKNRAAVIMVHSLSASRVQMRHFSRALVKSGYGVLLFDLRAHARSEGSVSTFGWLEINDVLGAADFLKQRKEIDVHRIGVLGFSMGAQIALRAAAQSSDICAVWADGPVPVVFRDHFGENKPALRQMFFTPWWGLVYRAQEWLTGISQPPPLVEVIGQISPRPVFIVASGDERFIHTTRRYFDATGEPKWWWQLDDIPFGSGVLEKGDDYDFKLIGFFNKAL